MAEVAEATDPNEPIVVLFDVDETSVHTGGSGARSWRATFDKLCRIRADIDENNESLGKKIRESKMQKIPYTLVIGDAEVAAGSASLESRDNGKLGALPVDEIISKLSKEIKARA